MKTTLSSSSTEVKDCGGRNLFREQGKALIQVQDTTQSETRRQATVSGVQTSDLSHSTFSPQWT